MRNVYRVTIISLLVCAVLVLAPSSGAQQRPAVLEQIAKAYGIDSFGQVEAIRYTWNGEIPGVFKLAHSWEWEPKTNKISYEGKDKDGKPVKVSYNATDLSSQPDAVKKEVTIPVALKLSEGEAHDGRMAAAWPPICSILSGPGTPSWRTAPMTVTACVKASKSAARGATSG